MIQKSSLLVLFILVLFTSCENEDDPRFTNTPQNVWIGEWKAEENCAQSGKFTYKLKVLKQDTLANALLIKNLFEIDQYLACIILGGDSCNLAVGSKINGFPVTGIMKWNQTGTMGSLKFTIHGGAPETCETTLSRF